VRSGEAGQRKDEQEDDIDIEFGLKVSHETAGTKPRTKTETGKTLKRTEVSLLFGTWYFLLWPENCIIN